YVAGFRYALENGYDIIIQMDADFSHDPEYVPKLLKKLEEGYDLVLGSRYINGVNVVHWPMKRLLLSYLANWYSRKVTGMPVRDATGGFKVFRRKVLESLDLDRISASGYAFQIETTFRAWLKGFKVCEVPIVFWERRWGESKMRFGIAWEAVWLVWKLRFERCFRRPGWTSR
ncbi:MAG TPA: glycosyltransferase, partial [Candidatus Latescibacteria bacterium]|nr:glycosyltransferase [Candidatus Latescibacterota bacterium]